MTMPVRRNTDLELKLATSMGEISQANKQIAETLVSLNQNLRTMNDQNILHAANTANEHNTITKALERMDKKYWIALVVLLAVLLLVLGYKEAVKIIFQSAA